MVGDRRLADLAFARLDAAVEGDGHSYLNLADFEGGQKLAVELLVEADGGDPFGLGPGAVLAFNEAIGGEGDADDGGVALDLFDAADAAKAFQ